MRAAWLLALYPRRWRERYGAEMASLLSDERLTATLLLDVLRGAFDAHRHPELVAPLLATAGGGMVRLPPRSPRASVLVLGLLFLLVLGFGGLYAYRAQTPPIQQVPVTQVVSAVQAGRVTAVEFAGIHATVTYVDNTRQQTTVVNGSSDLLAAAVNEYNASHSVSKIRVDYVADTSGFVSALPVLVGFLGTFVPILVFVLLFLAVVRRLTSTSAASERGHRYEWLARLAELRDRGVLTDEEFQREKKRLLEDYRPR